jgi:hypothetical protein
MNHKRSTQKRWASLMSWLLVVAAFLVTPTTGIAATAGPEQDDSSSYLPLLYNNDCSGQRAGSSNAIGTQVYGSTGISRNFYTPLYNTQPVWIRNSIVWSDIEPTNRPVGQYIWGAADNALRASTTLCSQLIVTIENTPAWATILGKRSPIRTENLGDYVEFVTAVVERYDGDGGPEDAPNGAVAHYFEFYNEPDFGSQIAGEAGWGEHGARYAAMLKAVYPAVQAASDEAKVVFGGIAYNNFVSPTGGLFVRTFLESVLAAGGGEFFDYMNFHYYPFQRNRSVWTQGNASGLREKIADIRAKLDAAGVGDKRMMITEVGWHSVTSDPEYPSNPEYQARRVLELHAQAMALGVEATIWWTFDDQGPEFPYSTGLGTRANPIVLKPSYTVYAEAVKRLGTSKFDGDVVVPTDNIDLEAYRFLAAGTNKPFYVAWLNPTVQPHRDMPIDDGTTQNLQVDGESADILHKDGTLKQSINDGSDGADDGKLTVSVGRSPIYIILK